MAKILSAISAAVAETVAAVATSVVRIGGRGHITGSGIVWSTDGFIITAEHIVDQDLVEIGLDTGRTAPATVVGRDPAIDIALLRTEAVRLTPPPWAESEKLRTGDIVIALARPGHIIRASLGIISALGKRWDTPAGGNIEAYIETDLGMFSGFSGGPLISSEGTVLGLNTTALLRCSNITVPIGTLRSVVEALLAHRPGRRSYLGIVTEVFPLRASFAKQFGQETGLLVVSVQPDSPAEQAGILLGDTILSIGGQPVRRREDLPAILKKEQPGTPEPVLLIREGHLEGLSVVLGERR